MYKKYFSVGFSYSWFISTQITQRIPNFSLNLRHLAHFTVHTEGQKVGLIPVKGIHH